MVAVRFYDLTNGSDGYWSPNTCKTRFALNVKGIEYETTFLNFPDVGGFVANLTQSEKKRTVPVIVDLLHDDKVVHDSQEIAKYLEEAYPDTKSLFHGGAGVHQFFHDYATSKLLPKLFKLIVLKLVDSIQLPENKKWFRESREKMFNMTLEEFVGKEEDQITELVDRFQPVGFVLRNHPFLTGTQVGWADVVLAAYMHMLYFFRPELFELIFLNHPKYGKNFAAWWSNMQIYMKDKPPTVANL